MMFTGKSRTSRVQMARDRNMTKESSLQQVREARKEREMQAKKSKAATDVQRVYRGWKGRHVTYSVWRKQVEALSSVVVAQLNDGGSTRTVEQHQWVPLACNLLGRSSIAEHRRVAATLATRVVLVARRRSPSGPLLTGALASPFSSKVLLEGMLVVLCDPTLLCGASEEPARDPPASAVFPPVADSFMWLLGKVGAAATGVVTATRVGERVMSCLPRLLAQYGNTKLGGRCCEALLCHAAFVVCDGGSQQPSAMGERPVLRARSLVDGKPLSSAFVSLAFACSKLPREWGGTELLEASPSARGRSTPLGATLAAELFRSTVLAPAGEGVSLVDDPDAMQHSTPTFDDDTTHAILTCIVASAHIIPLDKRSVVLGHLLRVASTGLSRGTSSDRSSQTALLHALVTMAQSIPPATFIRTAVDELSPAQSAPAQTLSLLYDSHWVANLVLSVSADTGTLNDVCGLYSSHATFCAQTRETQFLGVPLMSRLAAAEGLLATLYNQFAATARWLNTSTSATSGGSSPSPQGVTVIPTMANCCNLFLLVLDYLIDKTSARDLFVPAAHPAGTMLTADEATVVVRILRDFIFMAHTRGVGRGDTCTMTVLRSAFRVFKKLHLVDEKSPLCKASDWVVDWNWSTDVKAEDLIEQAALGGDESDDDDIPEIVPTHLKGQAKRSLTLEETLSSGTTVQRVGALLVEAPYLIPFPSRAKIFNSLLEAADPGFSFATYSSDAHQIRRSRVFEDAYNKLRQLTPSQMVRGMRITFVDDDGVEEAGFGNGVFKEFVLQLGKQAFLPSVGLFIETCNHELYPNPASHALGSDHLERFEFLGRMLGKAVREGILLDIPFAYFFRNSILARANGINELASLDPALHKNLLRLLEYSQGEIEALDLTFVVAIDHVVEQREVPLLPGGDSLRVTRSNVLAYIHRVAHFKLNQEFAAQSAAFRRGLGDIVRNEWFSMFDANELNVVLQGQGAGSGEGVLLDISDWRSATKYGGKFTPDHPTVLWFWEVVYEMTPQEQRDLLRFVTSVDRAPLLGFAHLQPGFAIHGYEGNDNALPSAATCMCLLKMPVYPTKERLRSKLLTAIETQEFGLS